MLVQRRVLMGQITDVIQVNQVTDGLMDWSVSISVFHQLHKPKAG